MSFIPAWCWFQWFAFIFVLVAVYAEADPTLKCPGKKEVWFKDDYASFAPTDGTLFEANGFGTTTTGSLSYWFLHKFVFAGAMDTFDIDHIADFHDVCFDICGADLKFCDQSVVEYGVDYCYCVFGIDKADCDSMGKRIKLIMAHFVTKPTDKWLTKPETPFEKSQNLFCECIDPSATSVYATKVKTFLEKIKAIYSSAPDISAHDYANTKNARKYIFGLLKDVNARKALIQGHNMNMQKKRTKASRDSKTAERKLQIDSTKTKRADYCKASMATKMGFMTVPPRMQTDDHYLTNFVSDHNDNDHYFHASSINFAVEFVVLLISFVTILCLSVCFMCGFAFGFNLSIPNIKDLPNV